MENRIITFGEIMMRLNPEGYLRFVQADKFEATYAGGEANVAVSLANYGMDAAFVSKVPAHEIGQCAVNELRRYGVDTSLMLRGGARLGVYYCEKGASQRASKVIYDRAGSAIATAAAAEFDWDKILDGADWFHWTGITPALGGEMPEACLAACKAAKEKGLTVSCDLNYRKKLWTREQAGECMAKLLPYVDVCIANEEDAKDVFGIEARTPTLIPASSIMRATSVWRGRSPSALAAKRSPSRCAARSPRLTTTGPVCSMTPHRTARCFPPPIMSASLTVSAAATALAAA